MILRRIRINLRWTGRKYRTGRSKAEAGFTLLELLVVLFIVGLIAAIAAPNVSGSITRAKEAALSENLFVMRKALDDYYADRAVYPQNLDDLVNDQYLRHIPPEPFSNQVSGWAVELQTDGGGIVDVHSASGEQGLNDVPYNQW